MQHRLRLLNTFRNVQVSVLMPVASVRLVALFVTAKHTTQVVFRFISTSKQRLRAVHKVVFVAAQQRCSTRFGT